MDFSKKLFWEIVFFIALLLFTNSCAEKNKSVIQVQTGADILLSDQFDLIKNKKVGIITNHTALLSGGVHLVDTLFNHDKVRIVCLFGPEHGIRGDSPDGHSINDGFDSKTGLPVFSLYGKTKKPAKHLLDSIDVLIFDIQDIGARFYTFISTMYYAIQSAAENNIPIIILDRPNPINGIDIQGPLLKSEFKSFVGIAEIPIRHGLTVGELALYFNQTNILGTESKANLEIVKMKNWSRDKFYNQCNLTWIKPSPNMPILETALAYPGLCLLEGTNISEGRGTYSPFLKFGSPYIKSREVINELNLLDLKGCELASITFTPKDIQNMSSNPKYKNQECYGIELTISNMTDFKPIEFAVKLLFVLNKLYPQEFSFREKWIDKLWGSNALQKSILDGETPKEIILHYQSDIEKFKYYRKQFLLY